MPDKWAGLWDGNVGTTVKGSYTDCGNGIRTLNDKINCIIGKKGEKKKLYYEKLYKSQCLSTVINIEQTINTFPYFVILLFGIYHKIPQIIFLKNLKQSKSQKIDKWVIETWH